ncbi:MAG: hypothetical protein KGR98_14935, partial [Verrucomicrobia bacterium]|nr:hypothetical protein [Verrucomicrobiota bacterium]
KTLPVAAADGMATNAPPAAPVEDKFQLLRDLRAWATRDPQAALAAALKLPAGDERNQGLEAVCFGLAQNDPADAVKLAQKLNLNANSDGAMQNLMQQWASADASSALTWTLAQPAGDERDALVDRVAFIMSQTDPSDAANVVINDMPPGSAQDQAVMSVLHQWALQDVIGAADWVATFPPGSLRDRALSELEDIEHYQQAMQAAH